MDVTCRACLQKRPAMLGCRCLCALRLLLPPSLTALHSYPAPLLHLQAVTHYNDPAILAEVSCDLGEPMVGIDVREKGFKSYAQRSE